MNKIIMAISSGGHDYSYTNYYSLLGDKEELRIGLFLLASEWQIKKTEYNARLQECDKDRTDSIINFHGHEIEGNELFSYIEETPKRKHATRKFTPIYDDPSFYTLDEFWEQHAINTF